MVLRRAGAEGRLRRNVVRCTKCPICALRPDEGSPRHHKVPIRRVELHLLAAVIVQIDRELSRRPVPELDPVSREREISKVHLLHEAIGAVSAGNPDQDDILPFCVLDQVALCPVGPAAAPGTDFCKVVLPGSVQRENDSVIPGDRERLFPLRLFCLSGNRFPDLLHDVVSGAACPPAGAQKPLQRLPAGCRVEVSQPAVVAAVAGVELQDVPVELIAHQ